MNFIEELRWRGLIHDITPGAEEFLNEKKTAGYLGIDPTSDSMHIGNLVTVMILVHFQRAGHTPIALVGGATGMVGDPSGKDKERQLMTIAQVRENAEGIRKQLEHFLDFEAKDNAAIMVNNYDWFKEFRFLDFLRDVGKHITISYMLSKESVKKRMNSEVGISYTEFAYQLLQGYDYYHLYKNHGARLQVGGSDQWGNITTGTELIRRMSNDSDEKAYAVVCPLLTREDGSKFGKTADGQSVWLDPDKTSPYEFYQYWFNARDDDAEKYIKIFTLMGKEEIEGLIAEHRKDEGRRVLQKAIAEDITTRVHGEAGLKNALMLTDFLFGKIKSRSGLEAFDPKQWRELARSAHQITIAKDKLKTGMGILELMTEAGITQSRGEARRSIEKDRSVKVNLEAVEVSDHVVNLADSFHDQFLLVQRGKKNRYIIELT